MSIIQQISCSITATATAVGALTIIIQACTKYNPLKGIRSWFNQPVFEILNEHTKTLHELKIDKLKSDICNEKLPLTERVNSADRYLKEGYNGEIKIMCKLLKEELEKQIKEGK